MRAGVRQLCRRIRLYPRCDTTVGIVAPHDARGKVGNERKDIQMKDLLALQQAAPIKAQMIMKPTALLAGPPTSSPNGIPDDETITPTGTPTTSPNDILDDVETDSLAGTPTTTGTPVIWQALWQHSNQPPYWDPNEKPR